MNITTVNDMYNMLKCIQTTNPQKRAHLLKHLASLLSVNSAMRDHFYQVKGVSRILGYLLVNDKKSVNYALCVLAFSSCEHVGNQSELTTVHVFWLLYNILRQAESLITSFQPLLLTANIVHENEKGQNLLRESGCLKHLISVFLSMSQQVKTQAMGDTTPLLTPWRTVCYCITTAVHNPLNSENQDKLKEIIPEATTLISIWIQNVTAAPLLGEFVKDLLPVLSYIIMANHTNQFYFAASSGIHTTVRGLVVLEKQQELKQGLSVVMNKLIQLLNMSIVDNIESCKLVGSLGGIQVLLQLLLRLNAELQLSALLALASLVESCSENKTMFLDENGLTTIILAAKHSGSHVDVKTLVDQLCKFITQNSVERSSKKQVLTPCMENLIDIPVNLGNNEKDYCRYQQPVSTSEITDLKMQSEILQYTPQGVTGVSCNVLPNDKNTCKKGQYLNFKIPLLPPKNLGETFASYLSSRCKENTVFSSIKVKEPIVPNTEMVSELPGEKYKCLSTWFNRKAYSSSEGCQSQKIQIKTDDVNEIAFQLNSEQSDRNKLANVDSVPRMQTITSNCSYNHIQKENNSHKWDKMCSKSKRTHLPTKYIKMSPDRSLENSRNKRTPKTRYSNAIATSTLRSTQLRKLFRKLHQRKQTESKQICTSIEDVFQPNNYKENIRYVKYNKQENKSFEISQNHMHCNYKCDVDDKEPYSQEELRNLVAGVKQFGFDFKAICREYKFHKQRTPEDLYLKWTSSFISKEQRS